MRFYSPFFNKNIFTAAICCLLLACSESNTDNNVTAANNGIPPGVTLLERVLADGELLIPYSKFQLDNGLTLVIHEDHSDPIVRVDVTYHVGSAREEPRRSGFAHFFEHMMFQGSEHVGDDEHFRIVTEAGGTMNGTTNNDRTNYFQTVPSNQLETMLWLESDRMGFLLDAVTQEKFEIQRDTVKNERGQNVDNSPYGRFGEVNASALYPPAHPYSWPVIGYPEDLDAATLDDLKNFFLRWYWRQCG
jgi:zinc protease